MSPSVVSRWTAPPQAQGSEGSADTGVRDIPGVPIFTCRNGLNLDMHICVSGGLALRGLAKSAAHALCSSQHLPGQRKVFWKRYQRGRRIKSFWDFPGGQLPGWLTPRSHNASTGQTTCIGCLLLHFGPGVYAKLYMHRDSCWSYRNTKQITKLF